MRRVSPATPDLVPVLSPGRHRNPRKGACFMEMASFLAGERWSDHPKCTHPLLAHLARLVNDSVPDSARAELVPLIPSVIGLASDDPRLDARIALRCATAALPIASATRQNALAVAVLSCERVLADLDGRPPSSLSTDSQVVLAKVPDAARWAREFRRDLPYSQRGFRRQGAPHITALAVEGIALACVDDASERLVELLRDCIAEADWLIRGERARQPSAVTV